MASGISVIGLDITDIDSPLQTFTPGQRGAITDVVDGSGVKEYVYVRFAASTVFALGNAVAISPAGVATPLTSTNAAAGQAVGRRVGVVVAAVASSTAAQFGWVQVYGVANITVTAAQAINTALTSTATAGHLGAAGVAVTGIVNTTVGAGATPVAGMLNYPFVTG